MANQSRHDCPCCTCGKELAGNQDRVEQKRAELERLCKENGLSITLDGYVRSSVAERIIGRSPGTLRTWRTELRPLPGREVCKQWQYSLTVLAAHLVEAEEKYSEQTVGNRSDCARTVVDRMNKRA